MARAETTLRENPAKIWSVLSQPAYWDKLFYDMSFSLSLLPTFALVGGAEPGAGAKVAVYRKRTLIQTWAIEHWEPPHTLGMRIEGCTQFPMVGAVVFQVKALNSIDSSVVLEGQLAFQGSFLDGLLNLLPLDRNFERTLKLACARLPQLIERL